MAHTLALGPATFVWRFVSEVGPQRLEDRMDALNTKIDVSTEAVRGDIKLVLERVDSLGAEMRREFATVRKEHQADRQLIFSVLKDHGMRLRALESTGPPPQPDGAASDEA